MKESHHFSKESTAQDLKVTSYVHGRTWSWVLRDGAGNELAREQGRSNKPIPTETAQRFTLIKFQCWQIESGLRDVAIVEEGGAA